LGLKFGSPPQSRRARQQNGAERILREIRRRTRVAGAFPDGQSALNRLTAFSNAQDVQQPPRLQLRHSLGNHAYARNVEAPT
jgi:transposase-like protein